METVLETHGLHKRYGNVVALRSLDLEVKRGEVFGFLGPNGAGKTTFTKCVTGFVRPNAGDVRILGEDAVRTPTRVAPHIGLVPDQYDFYPNLTGRQHLDFYGRLQGLGTEQRRRRIGEVLDIVRMTENADRRVKGYSHGMKQRICIAQAILHQPELILFDEPTNGLDPQGAYELRELMKSLAKDGTTVFLNSHQLTEVEQVCERVAILHKGVLRTVGRIEDLRRNLGGASVAIRLRAPTKKHLDAASQFAGAPVRIDQDTLTAPIQETAVPGLVKALVDSGAHILSVTPSMASLESVFLEVTGGAA